MHVPFVGNVDDPIQTLFVGHRAQRRRGKDLRLTARKDGAAVNARNVVHLRPNRPDFVGFASVGTNLVLDDHHAQLFLFHRLDDLLEVFIVRIFEFGAQCFIFLAEAHERFLARQRGKSGVAFALIHDAHGLGDVFLERLLDPSLQLRVVPGNRELAFGFGRALRQLVDRCNDLLDFLVCERDGGEQILLAQFLAAALDHHDRIGGSGDDNVHAARFILRKRRVAQQPTVLVAPDANRRDAFGERNVGDG